MYKFKQIKAKYSFFSEVIKPSGERSVFSKIEMVDVLPNRGECLNFILKGSADVFVDGHEPEDFDLIMYRLGQSLYPIELDVLKTGKIKQVKNFAEIQNRWSKECKSILATHKNAYWVVRYINMTSKNICSEVSFLEILGQNNFIQLFLMEQGKIKQHIELSAFPFANSHISVEFNLTSSNETGYQYKSKIGKIDEKICSGYGELDIIYTEKGQPEYVRFLYRVEVHGEGFYHKKININLITNK
jgi:hypothetical protein